MSVGLRLLIVGGYGTFGGRIVELLENEPRLTILIAGRSEIKAQSFCKSRFVRGSREAPMAQLIPAFFDRNGDVSAQVAHFAPDILIDASGPFQSYGDGSYRLIDACIAQGVNYLDLADGSGFVAGVSKFDAAAQNTGIFVLSGVSSFPVLTAAVVRRLATNMATIKTIKGGIAPSPYAGVGLNVIRAIAGYAGQKIQITHKGEKQPAYPLTQHQRFTIAPPGRLPLKNILFSLVDVPDLSALTILWPEAKTVWMGAGPVPEILHQALTILAWLVRFGLLRSLLPLAPLMHFATNHLRWGEHRGGMFVEVVGVDVEGLPVIRSWHLLAEGSDGPLIPSMAVEALVRRALDGKMPISGARSAVAELELDDYDVLFSGKTIYTGFRDNQSETTPLYERLLGSAWAALPAEIRQMHVVKDVHSVQGRASVERGNGLLSRLAALFGGFPHAVNDTSIKVDFSVLENKETWTRNFGSEIFSSQQFEGVGRYARLLCEKFGPLTFAMALVVTDGRLELKLRHWSFFGIPLPMWLCPKATAYEEVREGRFCFFVEISHPLTGLIVRYKGWLVPTGELGPVDEANISVSTPTMSSDIRSDPAAPLA